jgi:hypothetical protein
MTSHVPRHVFFLQVDSKVGSFRATSAKPGEAKKWGGFQGDLTINQ